MLGVDERCDAAHGLCLRDDFQRKRGLAGRLGTVDLDDAAARDTADAQCGIQGDGSSWNSLYLEFGTAISVAHDRAVAEFLDDIGLGDFNHLLALFARGALVNDARRAGILGHCSSLILTSR
ncbi:Uncharacterised protein [Collinsella intestinalis]|nr:Uncharacterised protein [Collinsella intestinalis]